MTWVVPLVLGALAIVLMSVVSALQARKARRARAQPAATPGPRILVHDINDDRCTGCDACVAVCPTNVLDLVSNKSRVLRFHDCIQCEACMWACPTEALVMFPEGAQPPPLKVPEIDENFQTKVPGQYLIGEVAGKPLVKNAANLGRAVVEHMLANGLQANRQRRLGEGSDAKQVTSVDVVIVGSGPGGLSAALTCIQRGLSYVVLEKEQMIASTIARYPKGKLVMAEPYDTLNVSFLPVFDSSKEQIVPIWQEVVDRIGVEVKLGEAVESAQRQADGSFDVRTTVAAYRAQRVVLATGTRGKPRTLQVPGENLTKVSNLLDDPAEFRGRSVLVVGGGDSAVEAALALADAGAKVMVSYRGRAFNRAQPKNKQAIESYVAQNRIKVKLQSQVIAFEAESMILQLADGSQKRYPNHAAFVLIGADPPVKWLEKLGVKFVERPHQYALGKTDDFVRRMLPDAAACPETAAGAAALVLGHAAPPVDRAIAAVSLPAPERPDAREVTGARKWLRSATSLFTQSRKLDQPMPLSEFAKRSRTHSGQGRRDALSPGERTRVLRMLRDVGGRLADEESQVSFLEAAAPAPAHAPLHLDPDDLSPPPEPRLQRVPGAAPPPPPPTGEVSPKQAVIVGLAKAMSKGPTSARTRRPSTQPPAHGTPPQALPPARLKRPSAAPLPPPPTAPRRGDWQDEPTRQADPASAAALLRQVRDGAPRSRPAGGFEDESTRAVDMDAEAMMLAADDARPTAERPRQSQATGKIDLGPRADSARFDRVAPEEDPTAFADVSELVRRERTRQGPTHDDPTRAIDLGRTRSLSDVEWDLD
ncbi:MAG: NAD(P)-binding domain-containing protein [Kofleriaceae bacterium]|nr:NAD(P)-binding domain-containing protein [Kofleriaceae bacterium]